MDIFIHNGFDRARTRVWRVRDLRFRDLQGDLILLALHDCEIFSTPWCLLPEPSFFLISHLDLSSAFFRVKYALSLFIFFFNHSPIPLNIPFWNINRDNTGAYRSMPRKELWNDERKLEIFLCCVSMLCSTFVDTCASRWIKKFRKIWNIRRYIYILQWIINIRLFLKNFLR